MIRRRAFGGWTASLALAGRVQAQVRPPAPARIAWISSSRRDVRSTFLNALRQGLEELGRVEERNFRIDTYWGEDSAERIDALVEEMLRSKPDLIVTQGPVIFNVQRSGTQLPVVFGYSGDPVEGGLVESLARPGRNLTGISMMSLELVGKRMQALVEALPGLRKVAVITNPGHAGERGELAATRTAASTLGLELAYLPMHNDVEMEAALSAAEDARCQAISVFPDAGMMRRSERFAEFATRTRMPAVSGWAEFARRGNVMSYGPNVLQVNRRLASYVDRVLKGMKPAELPVELPTVIEHVINLRASRAIGLAIPRAVLLRADELIE
jgi:putative ABC transport system substrate-binding protein